MKDKTVDYNLLTPLKALLEERHVTRAAQKIGLSQPAMSRALGRLRRLFDDPLLARTSQGFDLTPKAVEISLALGGIIDSIDDLMSPAAFDPATATAEIRLAALDYEMAVCLPALLKQLNQSAPHITLCIEQQWGKDFSTLDKGELDFIISANPSPGPGFYRQTLYQDSFVCVLNKRHPFTKQNKLTVREYIQLKHCLVSLGGSGVTAIDKQLAKKKLQRDIKVRVPSFLAVPSLLCAQTDLMCVLPKRLADQYCKQWPLQQLPLPFTSKGLTVFLYWHARTHKDPLSKWLRGITRNNGLMKKE